MELQKTTKLNIFKATGLSFSELLEKKPTSDVRLKCLQRQQSSQVEDPLVRGNPQLTVGRITQTETVDAYFDKKREAGCTDGR